MKPYNLKLLGYDSWIDLSAIQMISSPFIISERFPVDRHTWNKMAAVVFDIQFAGASKPTIFEAPKHSDDINMDDLKDEIILFKAAYQALLSHWKEQ